MDVREKLIELMTAFYGVDPMYHGVDADALASHLIAHGVTVQEWISVKDRLPQMPGKYLVCGGCSGDRAPQIWMCECICIGSTMGWRNNAANPVVEAWTILPQPPKGE